MYKIIYDKKTNEVAQIIPVDETFVNVYCDEEICGIIEAETLPDYNEQTESLFVVNGQVVAKQDEYKLAVVKEAERQNLIAEKKALLLKYREDVEQVDLFGMEREDYEEKKAACRTLVEELRALEKI